jgi:hypothetical protein
MKIPAQDYPRFTGTEVLNKDMADNADIRRAIIQAVPKANQQVSKFAKHFGRNSQRETCKAIFDFLKNEIKYVADGSEQVIKLPSALLSTKVGDCKSYSLLTSAILTNLGIPHHFVLTSYNGDPTPSHIYVATDDGCIIDAVWGIFDSEKKPFYKYEVKPNGQMKVKTLSGVGNTGIGNPLIYAALAATPAIVEAMKKPKSVTGLGGCGCGMGNVGLGAFELDAASRAYCDRTYPNSGTLARKAKNKIAREACYIRERAQDEVKEQAQNVVQTGKRAGQFLKDLNLKQYVNAPFRSIYLGLLKFNVDGISSQLQKHPDKRSKLEQQFTRWGGDGRKVFDAVKEGASKKAINVNLFGAVKKAIAKVLPKGINGIGQTQSDKTMTPEEKKALYAELTKMGMEAKDWSKMSKAEKSKYISNKLTTGTIGTLIQSTLLAGGGAAATAVCAPMNVAAPVCAPMGAILGEAIYAQIPDLVDMIVRDDDSYNPVADTGSSSPSRTGVYTGDDGKKFEDDKGDNKMLLIIGGSIAGYLLYNKFLKK